MLEGDTINESPLPQYQTTKTSMESYMLKTNCRGPYTLLQTGLPIITQFTCMGSSLISKITFPNLPPPQVDRNYMVGAILYVYNCIHMYRLPVFYFISYGARINQ